MERTEVVEIERRRSGAGTEEVDDDAPERDGINLQCVNSSDFIVGKQTTFNGPVTIINYADGHRGNFEPQPGNSKEEIVIREKIITPTSVSEIKAFADKKKEAPEVSKEPKRKKVLCKNFLRVPIIVWILLGLVVLVACLAFFLGGSGTKPVKEKSTALEIPYDGRVYKLYPREAWKARPPLGRIEMKTPVQYVIISHPVTPFCYDRDTCTKILRAIQGDLMNRSPPYADIAYNFMVGGDGNIYEGRGWTTKNSVGGFASSNNIDVNFIGSFENNDPPTFPQLEAAKALIEYGVNNSYIDPNYTLIAANSTYNTLSPGKQVYKEIKNWPHFNPNPIAAITD